jgi:hypothetical protein
VQHPRSFHASPPRTSCQDKGLAVPWMCSSPSHPRATRRRPRGGTSPSVPKTTDWAEYRPLAFHGGSNLHFHYLRAATTRLERGSPRTKLRPGHLHQHAIAAGLRGVKTHWFTSSGVSWVGWRIVHGGSWSTSTNLYIPFFFSRVWSWQTAQRRTHTSRTWWYFGAYLGPI